MPERNSAKDGDFVVVVGPAPVGLLGVPFAKLRGARAVALFGLHADEARLQIGRAVGADHFLYASTLRSRRSGSYPT